MRYNMDREMSRLRKLVLGEAAMVEEAIDKAIRAFEKLDADLAQQVIDGDRQIDEAEIDVEEECLRILVLHTPVASDLRFIVTVLKMNNDLERMGDIAVSIARRAVFLKENPTSIRMPLEFSTMGDAVRAMVKQSLDALINQDEDLAIKTCKQDDAVDDMKRSIAKELRAEMKERPDELRPLLKMLDVTRHLERIGDLATNISEDVVYLVRGEIIRHFGYVDIDSA